MRTKVWLLMAGMTVVSIFSITSVSFADQPKLAGPIYKGAVPAVLADGAQVAAIYTANFGGVKALTCEGFNTTQDYGLGRGHSAQEAEKAGYVPGPWCFLTRDPIDKVKAFYDKAVGPMHEINGAWARTGSPVKGYEVYTERAWFPGSGEDSPPGFDYNVVSLHTLPAPQDREEVKEVKTTDDTWAGQEAFKFYSGTRHFGGFIEGVDWFGDPSKRKPAELDALYKKYNHLESALYQRKGPKSEPVDETLRAKFTALQQQGLEKARGGMVPSPEQIAQMQQAAQRPMPANQQATPEDAEFNAFMKRNPKAALKYRDLTQKMGTLMQQGKFDEADAVDDELQKLTDSYPELAELERRADERSAAIGVAGQAQENRAMANNQKQEDQAVWGTWLEYLNTVNKGDYYTLIVIDRAFRGDEKDYSRDHALLEKETAGWVSHPGIWEFSYPQKQVAQSTAPAGTQSFQQAKPEPANTKEKKSDAVKKGLNVLKKWL